MTTTLISGACAVLAAAVAVGVPSVLASDQVDCAAYVERIERIVERSPITAEVLASDLNEGAMRREGEACLPVRQLIFRIRHRLGDPCSATFPVPV